MVRKNLTTDVASLEQTPALQHYADAVEGLLQSAAARGGAGASTSAVANGGAAGEGMQLLPTLLPYPGGGFLQYHSAVPQANLQEPPAATTAGADSAAMGRCSLAIAGRRDSTSSDHCALMATASAAAVGLAVGTSDGGDAGALPLGTGAHMHAATAAGPEAQEGLDIGAGGGRQQPAAAAEPAGVHDAAAARPDGTAGAVASPPVPCLAGPAVVRSLGTGGPAVAQAPGPPADAAGAAGIDLPMIGFGITAPYSGNAVAARAAVPTPAQQQQQQQQQQQPQHCAAGHQDEDWVDAVVQDLDRRVSWTAATNQALVQTAVTVRLQADAAVAEAARRLAVADVQHQRELQAAREQAARELATAANQRDAADTAKAAAERQLEEVMRERDAALAQRDETVLQLQRELKEMRRQTHSAVMAAANAAHEQVARADQERRAAQALNDKLRLALAKAQQALLPPPPSWQGPQ